jgi:YbbR domain-containing protein
MRQKILYGLLALVVSFGLWLYVITVENPASEVTFYNIPVVLDNESVLNDRGLMVLDNKTPTVTLTLSGNRSNLNKLTSQDIRVVVDLSRVLETGEQTVPYTITYPGNIPQNSIDVLSQMPDLISLTIVERDSMNVPVRVETTGKVPNGFVPVIDKMFLSHTSIPVAGPASLIKEIKEAVITIDLEGRKEHIDQNFRYTIYDKNGNPIADTSLKTNVPEVKVSLLIQKYKDIPVVLGNIIPGGGATADNTKITWDVQTVRVAGSEQLLNSLEQLDLGEIDLGSITKDGVQVIQLADCLPDGATIMSATKEARITIDLDNSLRTKTLTITQFVGRNLPEEMMVEFLTTSLTVEFRGKSTEISKLTEAKVVAWVDFANAEPGTDTYTVKFEISGLDTIGAMSGTYTVSAVLTATPTA